jgi:molecular chaperone DnaK
MGEIAIGIDLGTSNSCVAVLRGGAPEVIRNSCGETTTASVVALSEDGAITVGNAAKANIIHDPTNTVYSAKRLIGRYFFSEEVKKARAICSYEIVDAQNHGLRIKIRDELFSLPEIAAMVLREMKSIAEAQLGQQVSKAVITVPAYFNDNQRQATKDAGRIAGLEVLRILNEPTAAALAYGFGRGLSQRVAVYDLGGGTFDISVLEIGEDVFEVLATCGDTFLGGDDFDDRMIDLLADEFTATEGINLRNDPYALEKLKVAAEGAKKSLSLDGEVEIRIPDIITRKDGSAASLERNVDEAEYAALVNDLILRTFKVCDEALQQAGIVARDLDGVILVGGPTRLPAIRGMVRDYFQQDSRDDVDPDLVVAMGAAIHAASLASSSQESYLLDITPLSLKIGVAGGLAETVIERNTPVPIEQTRTFTTFQDYQESVKIRVYQGESRNAEDNEMLGEFSFTGFKKALRGQVAIDVTFEINADGIVNVTAADPETGQQASTRMTLSSGLSESEIQNIIEKGRTEDVKHNRDSPAPAVAVPPSGIGDPASEEILPIEEDPVAVPPSDIGDPASEEILPIEEDPVAAADELVCVATPLPPKAPEMLDEIPVFEASEGSMLIPTEDGVLAPAQGAETKPLLDEPVLAAPAMTATPPLTDAGRADLLPDEPMDLGDAIDLTDAEICEEPVTLGLADTELSDIELSAQDIELSAQEIVLLEGDACLIDVEAEPPEYAEESLFETAGSDLSDPDDKD